eukprot:5340161-Pyramimonas_sp.AAC.1
MASSLGNHVQYSSEFCSRLEDGAQVVFKRVQHEALAAALRNDVFKILQQVESREENHPDPTIGVY